MSERVYPSISFNVIESKQFNCNFILTGCHSLKIHLQFFSPILFLSRAGVYACSLEIGQDFLLFCPIEYGRNVTVWLLKGRHRRWCRSCWNTQAGALGVICEGAKASLCKEILWRSPGTTWGKDAWPLTLSPPQLLQLLHCPSSGQYLTVATWQTPIQDFSLKPFPGSWPTETISHNKMYVVFRH